MQQTKVLRLLRSIFPPIHAPRELSRQDTQRLLDAIKLSFRTQLDKEHGWAEPDHSAILPPIKSGFSYLPSPRDDAASPAANRHMHAVLSNPLFRAAEPAGIAKTSANTWEVHSAIFEKAVARGLMTLPRAQGFLMMVRSEVAKSPSVSLAEAMKERGAGLLVLRWLRSSGQENKLGFLQSRLFMELLMPFIVAEGLDGVVWDWFCRLLAQDHTHDRQLKAAGLLWRLVTTKARHGELEGAYAALLKAQDMAVSGEIHLDPRGLFRAWTGLAVETIADPQHRTMPPVHLFDPFVAMGLRLNTPERHRAHINLHHPAEPSAELAVNCLTSERLRSKFSSSATDDPNWISRLFWQNSKDYRLLCDLRFLGVATINHLMKTDKTEDASRLWKILEKHLGLRIPALPA
jgi:hypothetical protein